MRNRLLLILLLLSPLTWAGIPERRAHVYKATSEYVTYVGRTNRDTTSGTVRFDWSGTYLRVAFTGRQLWIVYHDTGNNRYNVWIDRPMSDEPDRIVQLPAVAEGKTCGIYSLYTGDDYQHHELIIQKRTEGEQGILTLFAFRVLGSLEPATPLLNRQIEFIGDSYTCGYGIEAASRDEHFSPRTENAGATYAALIARYFGADYWTIAHSGIGVVRNYNSRFPNHQMPLLYTRTLDWDTLAPVSWIADSAMFRPALTVIYLGGNDFSCGLQPSYERFKGAYVCLLRQIKTNYGDKHPILCVTKPGNDELRGYVERVVSECALRQVYHYAHKQQVYDMQRDMGADWHPNRSGHLKLAYALIPYIATLTGWEMMPLPKNENKD